MTPPRGVDTRGPSPIDVGRLFKGLLGVLLAALLLVPNLAATTAQAAPHSSTSDDGYILTLDDGNQRYPNNGGLPVLVEDTEYDLRLQYPRTAAGKTIELKLAGIEIPAASLELNAGNEGVKSITALGNGVYQIVFQDAINNDQGLLGFKFRATGPITESHKEKISWGIDSEEPSTLDVIVKDKEDTFSDLADRKDKTASVNEWQLSQKVKVVDGVVSAEGLESEKVTYTISYENNTATAKTVAISDQLSGEVAAWGSFDAASPKAKVYTWDADGLNRTLTDPFGPGVTASANSLSGDVAIPAFSRYELTYTVSVSNVAALEAALQAKYDALPASDDNQSFSVKLGNDATIDGTKVSRQFNLAGIRAGADKPNPEGAFTKGVDVSDTYIVTEENGALVEKFPLNYTLNINLDQYNGTNGYRTLSKNVVITDTLPNGVSLLGENPVTATPVLEAAGEGVTAETISSDANVGKYLIDGQKIYFNVGKEATTKYEIKIATQVDSVSGGASEENGLITRYHVNNTAVVTLATTSELNRIVTKNANTNLRERHKATEPVRKDERFKKSTTEKISVKPGESVKVPYTLLVNGGGSNLELVDVTKSVITDYVDHKVFDVDLAAVKASLSASYNWQNITNQIEVSEDADGHLVFKTAEAFNPENKTQRLEIKFELSSKAFEGKESIQFVNRASLTGASETVEEYVSEGTAEGSSYGDELEVRKTIYNKATESHTGNLRVKLDENNNLVEDEFIYRVQIIPHGSYGNVGIIPISDVLPEEVDFVGFVDTANVMGSGEVSDKNPYPLERGGLQAQWDDENREVRIISPEGTQLPVGQRGVELNFKVKVNDKFEPDVAITNIIGGTSATIIPSNGNPITVQKVDSTDPKKVISDPNAHFQLLNSEDEVLVDNIFVEQGTLKVKDGEGNSKAIVLDENQTGEFKIKEVKAPRGYVLATAPVNVSVAEDGTSESVRFVNVPRGPQPKVSVGDYVWWDNNRDGVQGDPADEPGIEDVTLTISRSDEQPVLGLDDEPRAELTTTTDENGKYLFEDLPLLPEGVFYVVTITNPDGAVPTKVLGDDGDRATDSSTGSATAVALPEDGDQDLTLDFGFVKPRVSVGDYVWWDSNGDGLQGDTSVEPGIEDVTLTISRSDEQPVQTLEGQPRDSLTTKTDEQGKYLFEELPVLPEGVFYVVTITNPEGATPTQALGQDDTRETDSSTGSATAISLPNDGDKDLSLDFGFVPKVSVGDYVWWDTNKDGVQGDPADEPGIEGVTLTISRSDEEPVLALDGANREALTTKTNENGKYLFEELPVLPEGVFYVVTVTNPDGGVPTKALGEEGERETDSSTGSATAVALPKNGDQDLTLDFGFIKPQVSVGDYVWWDNNGDGVQGDGEPGIPDVTLTISRSDEQPVRDLDGNIRENLTTTTDDSGEYLFENLPVLPEDVFYVVTVTNPEGATPTQALGDEGDRETDSSTGSATAISLPNDGDKDLTLDFGFVPKVSVGDYVWWDRNKDGVQGDPADEPGIEGVTLTISRSDEQPVLALDGSERSTLTTKTNENGKYLFEDLPLLPEDVFYVVTIENPADALPTKVLGEEGERETDSSTGSATAVALPKNGDQDLTLDFGFFRPRVSVGDFVWIDTDRDGIQDEGEPGIPGVELKITDPEGNEVIDVNGKPVGPVKTGENGEYVFDLLPTLPEGQSYTVTVVTAPEGFIPTKPGVGESDKDSSTESAKSNKDLSTNDAHDPTLDFGFVKPKVSVGDYVWIDTNRDGIQDEGEPGIRGVELKITDPEGNEVIDVNGKPVGPVKTDENGEYVFDLLPTLPEGQSYTVTVVTAPEGFIPTKPGVGESDKDSSTESAKSTGLTQNDEHDPTLDFGFVKPKVSVGDYVWWDNNGDGIQDEGEPGIPGVELKITDPEGNEVIDVNGKPVGPVKTDENGKYLFDLLPTLPEGQHYRVSVVAPEGAVATKAGVGESDQDSSTEFADSIDLTENDQHDPTLDFGFVPKVSVGDYVWLDHTGEGVQDGKDVGINDVTVKLTGPDGEEVIDILGKRVAPQLTRAHEGADGYYSFENLPVLAEGQSYTVTVDEVASATELDGLTNTVAKAGERAVDSETIAAQSEGLTANGERDDTLDFGYVSVPEPKPSPEPSVPVTPAPSADPTPSVKPRPGLPSTGR